MPGDVDLDDLPYEDFLSDDVELEKKTERESRKRQELLAKVDFSRYAIRLLVTLLSYSVRRSKVKAGGNVANICECSESRLLSVGIKTPLVTEHIHQLEDPGRVGKHRFQ